MKDEKYIKELLADKFKGLGNFQQFEFTISGVSRPDFVILDDKTFTYFEIKGENDTFDRLPSQISNGLGLFTHMFLVIPECHLEKAISLGIRGTTGIYIVEELEKENLIPYTKQGFRGFCTISAVADILWAEELRKYIRQYSPEFTCKDSRTGKKLTINSMTLFELNIAFKLFYSDGDALKILNEILPSRSWNYREMREYKKSVGMSV